VTCVGKVKRFTNPRNPYLLLDYDSSALYEPALFNPERPRDTPIKYNLTGFPMEDKLLDEVFEYIYTKLRIAGMKPFDRLSFLATLDLLKSEVLKASPGYPFVMKWKTKQDMLDEAMNDLADDFASPRVSGYFADFPKGDEFLKAGKRVREIAGMECPLLIKMLSLVAPFNAKLIGNAQLPLYLGISPYYGGWQRVINLKRKCQRGAAMDATGHDTRVPQEIMDRVCELRCRFLNRNEDKETLRGIYNCIKEKNLVDLDGTVWITRQGMPSGVVTTAEDNSLASWALLLYMLRKTTNYSFVQITDLFEFMIYGDDQWLGEKNINKDHDDLLERIQSGLAFYGYIIKQEGWKHPFDADFLSKVEKVVHGRVIPTAVRHRKFLDTMKWAPREIVHDAEQRFIRLLQLREQTFGTDSFEPATDYVVSKIPWLKQSVSDEVFKRLIRALLTSHEILEHYVSIVKVQSGGLKFTPDKNKMSKRSKSKGRRSRSQPPKVHFQQQSVAQVTKKLNKLAKSKRNKKNKRNEKKENYEVVTPMTFLPSRRPQHSQVAAKRLGRVDKVAAYLSQAQKGNEICIRNAMKYIASLYGPHESPAARFPDTSGSPTSVIAQKFTVNMTAVTQATTNDVYAIMSVWPTVNSHYSSVTAIDAAGALTWAAGTNAPCYSTFVTQVYEYRCNGLVARVLPIGANQNQGGEFMCLLYPGNTTSSNTYPPTLTGVFAMGEGNVGTIIGGNVGDRTSTVWAPLDPYSRFMYPVTGAAAGYNGNQLILALKLGNTGDAVRIATSFQIEIEAHYEMRMYPAYDTLCDTRICIGDPAFIAPIVALAMDNMDGEERASAKADFSFSGIWETIKGAAKQVWGGMKWAFDHADQIKTGVSMASNLLSTAGLLAHHRRIEMHLIAYDLFYEAASKKLCGPKAYRDKNSPYYVPSIPELEQESYQAPPLLAKYYQDVSKLGTLEKSTLREDSKKEVKDGEPTLAQAFDYTTKITSIIQVNLAVYDPLNQLFIAIDSPLTSPGIAVTTSCGAWLANPNIGTDDPRLSYSHMNVREFTDLTARCSQTMQYLDPPPSMRASVKGEH